MSSLLRSGKFVRFFSNFTRSIDLNNGGRNNSESFLCVRRDEWEIRIHRSLSTIQLPLKNLNDGAVSQPPNSAERTNVDRALARAELDAKKTGRITREDIDAIVQEIKQLKNATTTQSLLLIRCCGNLVPEESPTARTRLVQEIWKMLESYGVPLDVSHYNALLRVYLENEHNFNPMKFLDTLAERNIEANRVTYQRLMAAYCQRGDIDGASQILEIMKNKDLPIGELVFNSLVMGHANSGDMESAKSVIKVMSQAGLEPDSETYRALLCGYAKNGMPQEVTSTLSECGKSEITLHDRDLLEVLYTAAVNGHSSIVDDLLNRMQKYSGYNQDCINVILRLINHKQEDEAFKVLMSMKNSTLTDGKSPAVGGFFIRQIVRSNCSPEKIVSFCEKLVEPGLNNRAFFRALEMSNALNKQELSNILLKQIQKQKQALQPFAFWPLLNSQSKAHGEKGVLDALRQMAAVQVTPNVDTINQHVLPHMEGDDVKDLLRKLRSADVPPSVVALSLMLQSLNRGDFASATEVASKIYLRFDSQLFRRAAAEAYIKTRDANALATLVWSMLRKPQTAEDQSIDSKDQAADLAGPLLKEIYNLSPKPKLEVLEPVLKAFQEKGLGVSQNVVQYIQETAGDSMTESVAQLLVELGSGKLEPANLLSYPSRDGHPQNRRIARFVEFARENKLEEALKEKQSLEASKFQFTDSLNIVLMDLYVHHERFDDAMAIFSSLYANNPELVITPAKLLNMAANLVKGDRTEEALQLVQRLKPTPENTSQAANITEMPAWRLLHAAAQKEDIALTQKLFYEIEKSQTVKISSLLLGPLVKVHLNRDDVETAMKTFSQSAEKYNATPLKSILMARLIEAEDAQRLQQVMDVSIKVHGEMNSLYDLVFSFLESGRVRQAKKVLETPGLRARGDRLEIACRRYVEEKRVGELENLVKITKDVYGLDRPLMYNYLLTAYINAKNVAQAANLWTQMQEEDCQPSGEFMRSLAKFLTDNNQPVPFAVPEPLEKEITLKKGKRKLESAALTIIEKKAVAKPTEEKVSPAKEKFSAAIKDGNADAALQAKNQLDESGETLAVKDTSNLIEILVREGNNHVATKLATEMLTQNRYPIPRVFRFFLASLSSAGDHATVRSLGQYLNQEKRRLVSYENVLASAIAHDPSQVEIYLEDLLQEIRKAAANNNKEERDEELKNLNSKFPRGGILGILEKNPNVLDKCKEVADEYLKSGTYAPINALWCYFLISGSKGEAQATWEKLQSCPFAIGFQSVCRHIRDHQDLASAELLVEMLSSSEKVRTSALGVAYSAWLDALRAKNQVDEAMSTLDKAMKKGVQLSEINRSCLISLKTECEQNGRSFPFQIPQAVKEESRTDSGADAV